MKRAFITALIGAFMCSAYAQIDENSTFRELRTMTIELVQRNEIDSAITVMEYAHKNMPEEYQQSSALLAQVYTRAGKYPQAISIWKSGMKKGYNYHLRMPGFLNYYGENRKFEKLRKKEIALLEKSHLKHEVILPSSYNSSKQYPILFIFHGNNRNIELSKGNWVSKVLNQDFITVFVQSYIHSNSTRFVWMANDDKIQTEFKNIYNKILRDYSVDTSKIVFSGMSAGGNQVLEFAFMDLIPITGIILNCPVVPREITNEHIKQFVSTDKRIGIITGENDFALENQKNLVQRIKDQGGHSKIHIEQDLGHDFSDDFSIQFDNYLTWVIDTLNVKPEISFFDTDDAYFGQKVPGLIPEVFAPGIVSDSTWAEHCQMAISPNGKEIYWSAWSSRYPPADTSMTNSEQIYFSEFENGEWSKPAVADFIKEHLSVLNGGPSFTTDGKRLYFYSTGIEGGLGKKDVWYVEKTKSGWSKPINAGAPLNTKDGDWTPSFTKDGYAYHMGNYFYNRKEKPLKFKYSDGEFHTPDTVIIHPDYRPAWAFYVSPDEKYLIFSGIHKDGYGSLDIYICFKTDENEWGTPINMGDQINTDKMERFPVVSPDGKYLFFMRHTPGQDIFWVSTKVINEIKTDSKKQ